MNIMTCSVLLVSNYEYYEQTKDTALKLQQPGLTPGSPL